MELPVLLAVAGNWVRLRNARHNSTARARDYSQRERALLQQLAGSLLAVTAQQVPSCN
jgi:hypothetical protein